ncbi:MAG: TauD/TfdA family dioxygenase [Gammaproteobacteria bacterium]
MSELYAISGNDNAEARLLSEGAVLFRDVGVDSASEFEQFSDRFVSEWMGYQDRASKRSSVRGNVHTSTDTPSTFPIALHCESSFTSRWPQKIFFHCMTAPTHGGRTPICDVRQVYKDLDSAVREKFEKLGVMYYRNFGRGVGMDWRDVFQAEDQEAVEAYCAAHSILAEWPEEDHLRTTQVRPAVLEHPVTGEKSWFNHALALSKFSLVGDLSQTLMRQSGERNLPNNSYFGSGEQISDEDIQHIRDIHDRNTRHFDWQPGDVLMLDNMRVAHGREPFEGPRLIHAAMADPLTWEEIGVELQMPGCQPQFIDPAPTANSLSVESKPDRVDDDLNEWFLTAIASELKLDRVAGEDNFSEIGGDSLAGVTLIGNLFDQFGVDIQLERLLGDQTIEAILKDIQPQTKN